MEIIDIHDAKTQFSRLSEEVATGKEIIVAKAGRPVAKLVPLLTGAPQRKPGTMKKKIRVSDDFDAELPEEIQAAFEGRA